MRLELSTALGHGIRLVPVLVDRTEMPSESDLPGPLKPLARRHGLTIRNSHFGSDCTALIDAITEVSTASTWQERPPNRF